MVAAADGESCFRFSDGGWSTVVAPFSSLIVLCLHL